MGPILFSKPEFSFLSFFPDLKAALCEQWHITPLRYAAAKGRLEIVQFFIGLQLNPTEPDRVRKH